jgi:Asp-tRNA(Asn)/Glu-tRNA(Gln) amidotransferase A subunit family amidase
MALPASAGPLAHSMRDLELFFSAVSSQSPWEIDPDVSPSPWTSLSTISKSCPTIGIVRRDGVIDPLPPIQHLLDEVVSTLRASKIEIIEMDITPLFSQCQSLANALFSIDGGNNMFDLLEQTSEPLSPWLSTRLKRKAPKTLDQVRSLHARKMELETAFLEIWKDRSGRRRSIDAFICPVAPHPVPPIDRWNDFSYTSSFVLLDYPAGVVPVRMFGAKDMQGEVLDTPPLSSWDKMNRELCKSVICLATLLLTSIPGSCTMHRRVFAYDRGQGQRWTAPRTSTPPSPFKLSPRDYKSVGYAMLWKSLMLP